MVGCGVSVISVSWVGDSPGGHLEPAGDGGLLCGTCVVDSCGLEHIASCVYMVCTLITHLLCIELMSVSFYPYVR